MESCTIRAKIENQLLSDARAGDLAAFDELVARHQARVFRLAYRMLMNREDAADVQQETFIRAWWRLPRFREDAAFATWLHKIVVNLCVSRKRVRNIEVQVDGDWDAVPSASDSAPACVEKAETRTLVRKVIAAMPAHYRVLIVLRDMEERSFEEIAAILDCSVTSARMRTCKARRIFRERMLPYLAEEDR